MKRRRLIVGIGVLLVTVLVAVLVVYQLQRSTAPDDASADAQNSLLLRYATGPTGALDVGNKFTIEVAPQIVAGQINISEIVVNFDVSTLKASVITESTGLIALGKTVNNTTGVVSADVAATGGATFTSNQAIASIEFEVIAINAATTKILVASSSTLGVPDTIKSTGYGFVDIPLVFASSSSSTVTISPSSSTSLSSTSTSEATTSSSTTSTSQPSSSTTATTTTTPQSSASAASTSQSQSASSSESQSSSASSAEPTGNNELDLVLTSSAIQFRNPGDKFTIGVATNLVDTDPVSTAEIQLTFDPTLVKATAITEASTVVASDKVTDNTTGLVGFDLTAANGGTFSSSAVIVQIEFEVVNNKVNAATIGVTEDSTLGFPNTLSEEGFGEVSIPLNSAAPGPSSSSSASTSETTSMTTSTTTSAGAVPGDSKIFGLDAALVVYLLLGLSAASGVTAAFLFFKRRPEETMVIN